MINSSEFAHRLQQIMDLYQLTASAFAESVGVQRSAISHILSGRNKPSLDFILKILETYPDIELYWLLNGKGDGPVKTQESSGQTDLFRKEKEIAAAAPLTDTEPNHIVFPSEERYPPSKERKVVRVMIFYDDHTFEEVTNAIHNQ